MTRLLPAILILALLPSACGGGRPGESDLKDSFVEQLIANSFVRDVQRDGDTITFSAPTAAGPAGSWRVTVDSAVIEPQDTEATPFKGTVTSSWYENGTLVQPQGRESQLPLELTSNGLAQECWALWNSASSRWEWE